MSARTNEQQAIADAAVFLVLAAPTNQQVWNFDLSALEAAVEGRSPHPGKPMGSPDGKAN